MVLHSAIPGVRDALVVHCDADETWVSWIDEALADHGFQTHRLSWSADGEDLGRTIGDVLGGGVSCCVVVLSEAFLAAADYSPRQWRTALRDSADLLDRLFPVVVDRAQLPAELPLEVRQQIIDISDVGEQAARERLIQAVSGEPPVGRVPVRTRDGKVRTRFPASDPAIWCPWTPSRNFSFVGRDKELKVLHSRLWDAPRGQARVAITGLGGVGKSQIAVEYMYRYQSEYDAVWFVRATRTAIARQDVVNVGAELGTPGADDLQAGIDGALRALRDDARSRRWLVVVDDARSAVAVKDLLPTFPGQLGHVIITSTDENWIDVASELQISPMSPEESFRYLRSRLPETAEDDLHALVGYCDGLPIAMDLAAAQVRGTAQSVRAFLQSASERGVDQYEVKLGRHEKTVAQTYLTALDSVSREVPAAGELLRLLSFMASAPIPISLFGSLSPDSGLPELADLAQVSSGFGDSSALLRMLDEIRKHSLATIALQGEESVIAMHRVPQRVIVADIPADRARHYRHAVHLMLRARDIGATRTSAQWLVMLEIWRNLESSSGWECELCAADISCRQMMLHVIRALMIWSESRQCEAAAARAIASWRPALGPHHTDVREATLERANALRNMGRAAEALELDEGLARDVAEVPDVRPAIAIRIGLNRGGDLRRLGRFADARAVDAQTRDRAVDEFGPQDRLALMARGNVSVSYLLIGEPANALKNDEELIRDQVRLRGDSDRSAFNSRTRIARAHRDLGQYRSAVELQEHNTYRCERVFGPNDSATLRAKGTLASCLRKNGQYEEARRIAQTTVSDLQQLIGERHPETVLAMTELASCLVRSDRRMEAAELGRQALTLAMDVCGTDHPFTAICRNNLALVHLVQHDSFEAETLLNEAAQVFAALPTDHLHQLVVQANLATALWERGEFAKAEDVEKKLEPKFVQALGETHPTTLAVSSNRVTTFDALAGDDTTRLTINNTRWRRTIAAYQRVLSRDHPDVRIAEERRRRIHIALDAPAV
ncbi:tetratricopeptide (TPR) repeat protein [Catenulispora sp. GP43]|uniref:FxSxx-COOH system tetratricopeptide repeat protein n=1 Tax=Catenulispora sp. GP43 TaxID=3156263 RepID=UPI0035158B73